jgi:hypothetical protein
MFSEITIAEPIEKIVDDWDFFAEKIVPKFTMFRTVGQNVYGIRRRDISSTGIHDATKGEVSEAFELGPQGIVTVQFKPMQVHVTTGGTPHRVAHNLGFWHINDMDELYLPLPNPDGDELGHFLVIMQTPTGNEGDSYAWYCQQCLTMLFERHHHTGQLGMQGLFKTSELAVRAYNGDPKNRTCPECGHLNPLGYVWNSAKDTPEESIARTIW